MVAKTYLYSGQSQCCPLIQNITSGGVMLSKDLTTCHQYTEVGIRVAYMMMIKCIEYLAIDIYFEFDSIKY